MKRLVTIAISAILLFAGIKAVRSLTLKIVLQVMTNSYATLKKTDNRTNVLLLGIAGGDHEGPDLTDTILVASLDYNTHGLSLISVPRDIWSDTLKDKINSAYHYGEEKKKGGGIILANAVVEDVIGMPIHYTVVVNFFQFMKLIDAIGGIDVLVQNGFTDTEYPIAGKENDDCSGDPTLRCRYKTVRFPTGKQHMDGEIALVYVRSRHADGDEGTDFSRGKRQQDVVVAMKEKIFSLNPWFHPLLAHTLYKTIMQAVETTMNFGDQVLVAKYASSVPSSSLRRISLEPYVVVAPTWVYGRYALIPAVSFEHLHAAMREELQK